MKGRQRKKQTGESFGVVRQVEIAARPGNRLATTVGLILGGFVPVASYILAHYETLQAPIMWLGVVAGLAYSAKTVYDWSHLAVRSTTKAVGFVVLVEGVMTFSKTPSLALTALAILIAINGIATACNLSSRRLS